MDQKKYLLWLARQKSDVIKMVMDNCIEQRRKFHYDNRMKGIKAVATADNELEFFLSGVRKTFKELSRSRLTINDDLKAVDENRIKAAKAKSERIAPKKTKVRNDWLPVIERLRAEGLSWQNVSNYIALHHKRKVSRGYLQKLFAGKI
jgi:hypothetical protein